MESIKAYAKIAGLLFWALLIYGLLIAWAASGQHLGFGILVCGLYLAYKINDHQEKFRLSQQQQLDLQRVLTPTEN